MTDGLVAGDKVITDGFMKAPPGTPVQPVIAGANNQPEAAAPAKAAPATEQKQ